MPNDILIVIIVVVVIILAFITTSIIITFRINTKTERSILAIRTLSKGHYNNKYDTDFMINLVKEYWRRYLVSNILKSYEFNDNYHILKC